MILSDEQMSAACGTQISEWSPVEMPTGKQPIPAWCKDANVDWMNGCANSPSVKLKTDRALYRWENQRWRKELGGAYVARHEDGRASILYHTGSVSEVVLKDTRLIGTCPFADLPDVRVLATTQQDGFGGSLYWLKMEDGSDLVLRGPWHGGAISGYVEVGAVDMTAPTYGREMVWHKRGGGPSVYLTEEVFLSIVATYLPHAKVARVVHPYGTRLELYRAEWEAPKSEIYHLEMKRAQKKEPAGPFWRVYWDGSELYCGSLRTPIHGFQEGVA